jgi:hypothetical protein
MKPRYCRVCGQQFQPVRFDALTCSTTCRMRKSRGGDLGYLASLLPYLVETRRSIHEADLDAIATARAAGASRREGRRERREMPRVKRMHVSTSPTS